jgi:hypothetical protein
MHSQHSEKVAIFIVANKITTFLSPENAQPKQRLLVSSRDSRGQPRNRVGFPHAICVGEDPSWHFPDSDLGGND